MMNWMIASDIHGSAYYCRLLLEAYRREEAQRLLLLGDILYHGPRNDLPREYAPKEVIAMLSEIKNEILCVRGNCDTEVDQMVLPFPILADYALLYAEGKSFYATHGHVYHRDNLPPLRDGDILLSGHTHIPVCESENGILFCNPGSVSIPKEGSAHSYMLLEDGVLYWKTLQGGDLPYPFVKGATRCITELPLRHIFSGNSAWRRSTSGCSFPNMRYTAISGIRSGLR